MITTTRCATRPGDAVTQIGISRIHYPVEVLGPGRRLGIWVQGCSLACPGCVSRDTWDPTAGSFASVDEVASVAALMCADGLVDGVTISGGEPFEQADALAVLIPELRNVLSPLASSGEVDVMVYSGFRSDVLHRDHASLLDLIDVLVPEPFRAGAGEGAMWRGSANQRIEILSSLGRERFPDPGMLDEPEWRRRMQVSVDEDTIWMIGIPGRGDMQRLELLLAERGLTLDEASWRA